MLAGMFAPSARWHPRALFGAGEPGVVFDWSKQSSLYQDSARTTLVNAAGDPIGSVTDESGNGNHASQTTATSRFVWQGDHAETDGVDDWLVTPSIDFSGTDKVTIIASVHKSVDAGIAVIAELSGTAILNTNTFSLLGPVSASLNNFGAYSRGSGARRAVAVVAPAPVTAVVTAECDISAPRVRVTLGDGQSSENVDDQGEGNFGNYPLYIGARGGSGANFSGWFYRLIVIGRLLNASDMARSEAWAAKPAGVVLP